MTMENEFQSRHHILLRSWKCISLATSVFTMLPTDHEENLTLM